MTFFDFLTLIGGLSLFLFGMNLMGDALEKRAGNGLKNLLGKLTGSKAAGFLTGVGITPDLVVELPEALSDLSPELLTREQDAQLRAAIDALKAKRDGTN